MDEDHTLAKQEADDDIRSDAQTVVQFQRNLATKKAERRGLKLGSKPVRINEVPLNRLSMGPIVRNGIAEV
jgi:hypothetical protein